MAIQTSDQRAARIRDLERHLAAARAHGDLDTIKEDEHRLLLAITLATRSAELRRRIRRSAELILAILLRGRIGIADSIRTILLDLVRSTVVWFEGELHEVADRTRKDVIDDFVAVANVPQLRLQTSVPLTDDKLPKPEAVIGPRLENEEAKLDDVLLNASSMLVLPDDRQQEEITPLRSLVIPGFDSETRRDMSVNAFTPEVSQPWRTKVASLGARILAIPSAIMTSLRLGVEPDVVYRRQVQSPLGLLDTPASPPGYYGAILNELMHESLRVKGLIEDETHQTIDVIVGYTLHSRFLKTTAPDHAARDGWQFYEDNREGSRLPWAKRIIPPYRKNCVCFTIPILETPESEVYHAEFGLRFSRSASISIRDVGTWDRWFAGQSPKIQQTIIGQRRWFAVQSHGLGGRPRWSDFVGTNGRLLSPRSLASENRSAFQSRSRRMERIIAEQSRLNRAGWARGEGQFRADPVREREYRRRLEVFLQRVTSNLLVEQDCGTGYGGFKPGNVCATGGRGARATDTPKDPKAKKAKKARKPTKTKVRKSTKALAKTPPEKQLSERAARAKQSHNPSTKAKQDASERAEHEFTKKLGGVKSGDNLPMDIVIGNRHGVELKVMHDVKEGRVNMRPDSRARKEAWAKQKKGRTLSTVLIDNRDNFEGGKHREKYSGHKIYFAKGVGAFRLDGMIKVNSIEELRQLVLGEQ